MCGVGARVLGGRHGLEEGHQLLRLAGHLVEAQLHTYVVHAGQLVQVQELLEHPLVVEVVALAQSRQLKGLLLVKPDAQQTGGEVRAQDYLAILVDLQGDICGAQLQ